MGVKLNSGQLEITEVELVLHRRGKQPVKWPLRYHLWFTGWCCFWFSYPDFDRSCPCSMLMSMLSLIWLAMLLLRKMLDVDGFLWSVLLFFHKRGNQLVMSSQNMFLQISFSLFWLCAGTWEDMDLRRAFLVLKQVGFYLFWEIWAHTILNLTLWLSGRKNPTGPGIYSFKCRRAENLFNLLQVFHLITIPLSIYIFSVLF